MSRVAPAISSLYADIGDLLDVGSGGGQLGRAIRDSLRRWTAIEPDAGMRRRLRDVQAGPSLLACGWEEAEPGAAKHDTVLAANIAAPLVDPVRFLATCRAWARRMVIWVVPAQHGPRGLFLAGCLPAEWHGEDEAPGVEIVLAGLGAAHRPDVIGDPLDWSFRLMVPDVPVIAGYLADWLAWSASDPRRPELTAHLAATAEPVPDGFLLTVPRRAAILVWRCT